MSGRVKQAEKDKADKENFFLNGLNDNDRLGPLVTTDDPVAITLAAMRRANLRGSLDNVHQPHALRWPSTRSS